MIIRLLPISLTLLLLVFGTINAQEPTWTFGAGAVILERGNPESLPFGGGGAFDFDFEGGVEANLVRQLRNGNDLELRYFGINHRAGPLTVGQDTADYASKLHSTEINLHHPHNEWLTCLAGFRWVELRDEMTIMPFGASGNVDNQLYGFQIGAKGTLWDHGGPLLIVSGLKAGIYHNGADANAQIPDFPSLSASEDHTSFLGELDITGSLLLTQRCSLRAGYQFLWIAGIAEADQGASIQAGNALDMSSTAFYHGAFVGLEVTH